MKTLIIGDLHGKWRIVETALATKHNIIFIGDYLDSFTIKISDQIKTLDMVLDAAIKEPERVQALRGNHELSYEKGGEYRCSGWNPITNDHVTDRIEKFKILKDFVWLDNILVSHAGVSQNLLKRHKRTLIEYLEDKNFMQIGHSRGGSDLHGGIYWCDWFEEFKPIPGLTQVVGHTGYRPGKQKGILMNGKSYNIDCLDHIKEGLLYHKGDLKVVSLTQKI